MKHAKRFSFLVIFAVLAVTSVIVSTSHAATITIINLDDPGEGLNDPTPATPVGGNPGTIVGQQRLNVFERAAELWGILYSPVEILVEAEFNPLPCDPDSGVLGSAGPLNAAFDFDGDPFSNTLYPIALANALAGEDLDPPGVFSSGNDISAQFNSDVGISGCLESAQWYYGFDGNTPPNGINFLDTVLHEMAHGLGFLTFVNLDTGEKFFIALEPFFRFEFDDAFMLYLEDHSAGETFPFMTDSERYSAMRDTGDLHWIGPDVVANSGILTAGKHSSGHVEMYAPDPAEPGSSVSHWNTTLTPDELMEPFINPTMDRTLTISALVDMGWRLDSDKDNVPDDQDNCPNAVNPNQEDADSDGFGDVCDDCPTDPDKIVPGICGCGIPDEAGDMNCDEMFDIFDLMKLINCILGQDSCANGDLNGDGEYDIFDLMKLINKILAS